MRTGITFVVLVLTGCAALLPSIQSKHPTGYEKLIVIMPVCKEPNLKNYGACLNGADMLESSSAAQATSKFIAHWDQAVFGDSSDMKKGGTMAMAPERMYVGASVQNDQANAISQVSIPVLRNILANDASGYGEKMKKQLDLIVPL